MVERLPLLCWLDLLLLIWQSLGLLAPIFLHQLHLLFLHSSLDFIQSRTEQVPL